MLERQSELLIKEDFSRIYTGQGASGMNAGTSYDFTIYFVNVPANKLELWFWMESDRLLNPVFREFYSERDVVHEERRGCVPTARRSESSVSSSTPCSGSRRPIVGRWSGGRPISRA